MFVLQQYQIGLQAMEGRLGSENPKYKALATQIEAMRKAYQKNLVAARQQCVLDVAEARREAASAKTSLDEATAQVAAARRELIDLAITVGR